ncbi:MAG TPA: hypothetical protein DEH78_03030 [Solibacterales bacterium]|nr:hypothetical protein [Bryobacterales bacterium]
MIRPILLLAGALAFFRAVLFVPAYTVPWDFRGHHLPLATAYADALSEGVMPLWDPYTYCGRPLLANPQTAVFYPGMLLAAAPGRTGLAERLEWLLVLHVFLAGLFAYRLGRRLGLSADAALFCGFAFEMGAFLASQTQHLSSVLGAPWLVLSWEAVLLTASWRVPVLALSFTLHFFCGFTGYTLASAASTALFAGLAVAARRAPVRVLGEIAAAAVLSLALAAVQLWPALELVEQSVGKYRTDWLKGGGGIPPAAVLSLIVPDYHGVFDLKTFRGGYELTFLYLFSGWTTLTLAVLALIRGTRLARVTAGAAVLFLVLMLGEYTPVGGTLFALAPGFLKNTLYWYVFLAPFSLALALAAGFGLDALALPSRWRFALACAVAAELLAVSSGRPMNTARIADDPGDPPETVARLAALAGDGRIDTIDDSLQLMTTAPVTRLRAAGGYDPLALERLMQVRLQAAKGERWGAFYQIERVDSPAIDAMAIRVLTARGERPPLPGWTSSALPGRTVYAKETPAARYRLENGTVRVAGEWRQRVLLETDARVASRLVTSEVHYPGWIARVDGREQPVEYVNTAFRGLSVPAGRHRVEFTFTAPRLLQAMPVSLAAILVWLVLIRRAARSTEAVA